MKASYYGLLQETILIYNENSPDQPIELTFRLFVDEGKLSTDLDGSQDSKVKFPDVIVEASVKQIEPKREFELKNVTVASNYEEAVREVKVKNKSSREITVYPKTNLDVVVCWNQYNSTEVNFSC